MSDQQQEPSLTRRVVIGATWLVAGRWIARLIGLVSTVVLARLLTPEDFGIVALAGLTVAIIDALTDFRFGQALVRYQDSTDDEYDTAWTFNVIRGALVALVLVAGAWLFARIFQEPRLVKVFFCLGLAAILAGFENIGTIQFSKDLRFDRDFKLRIIQSLGTFIVTVSLTFLWRSYWALIAGMIAGNAIRLILSYVMQPYRPRFCISASRRLFAFSGWMMGGQVITLINQNIEQYLIGGFLSTAQVGIYNIAYKLAETATGEFVVPAVQALFPGFSQIAYDKSRLRQAYEKSVQFVVALGTAPGVGLALVAPEFVVIVLGPQWIDAVMPLRVLGVMFSISVLALASTGLLPAMGRTRENFIINMTQFLIRVPVTTLIVWQFGMAGAAWARLAFGVSWVIHYLWIVCKLLDLSFRHLFVAAWRSYAATAAMTIAVLLVDIVIKVPAAGDILNTPLATLWLVLIVKTVVGAATYVLSHLLFWQLQGRPDGPESAIMLACKQRLRYGRRSRNS